MDCDNREWSIYSYLIVLLSEQKKTRIIYSVLSCLDMVPKTLKSFIGFGGTVQSYEGQLHVKLRHLFERNRKKVEPSYLTLLFRCHNNIFIITELYCITYNLPKYYSHYIFFYSVKYPRSALILSVFTIIFNYPTIYWNSYF